MKLERVDCLLTYILAAAGECEFGRRELGEIHLLKYVFLADLLHAERNNGETFTGAPWRFHHFGPWAESVYERISPVIANMGARERRVQSSRYENDLVRWTVSAPGVVAEKERQIPVVVATGLKRHLHEFGDDTSALLHFVYGTEPMRHARPGDPLDFSMAAQGVQPRRAVQDRHVDTEKRAPTRTERLARARDELNARLEIRAAQRRERAAPSRSPRYDAVFFRGLAELDALAGEPIVGAKGTVVVGEEIWKSEGRTKGDAS